MYLNACTAGIPEVDRSLQDGRVNWPEGHSCQSAGFGTGHRCQRRQTLPGACVISLRG